MKPCLFQANIKKRNYWNAIIVHLNAIRMYITDKKKKCDFPCKFKFFRTFSVMRHRGFEPRTT